VIGTPEKEILVRAPGELLDVWKTMATTTTLKNALNAVLSPANVRLETRTAERRELARLESLRAAGHFDRPVFPVLPGFEKSSAQIVFDNLAQHQARFETFRDAARNDAGYSFANDYFSSPDAEVLYTLVRFFQPGRVIEIGSGNSTRITRQATKDGNLATRLISVDPFPRLEVARICDENLREPVENGGASPKLSQLRSGDFLFIDSSHEIKTGNDVVYLFLNVLPALPPGVIVHIHDIFLPYDYPAEWAVEYQWNEQYLVQGMLMDSASWTVLWPGHFLQRTMPGFAECFPHLSGRMAKSLWLQKRG
jgi:predicted O-methyltransferase YrrM